MAGHSKWSKVKRQKEVTDKEKSKIFAKLSKLITMAVVEGGGIGDPDLNVKLRLAIEKAKQGNMPKDNIERAIEKAAGANKDVLKEVHYEAFAKHGIALLIVATTDNPTRTIAEIKMTLDRHGGKLGAQGSVSYLFEHCAMVTCNKLNNKEEAVFALAEKLAASDIDEDEHSYILYIPFQNAGKIKEHASEVSIASQEIEYKPVTTVEVPSEDESVIYTLIEALDNLDDVQSVYTNAVFSQL